MTGNEPALRSVRLQAFLDGDEATRRRIAADVDGICRHIGFLIVDDHGVDADVIDAAWRETRAFFDRPLAEKMTARAADPGCPRGYFPIAAEALARSRGEQTPPDMKESFGIGPRRPPPYAIDPAAFEFHFGENLWPDGSNDLRRALTRYFEAMSTLADDILRLFAAALDLPHDWFEQYHTHPMCALRCLNYPAHDQPLQPGQRAAGAHSDYGSITVLKPDPRAAGLEIRMPDGRWEAAPLVDDGFIVNIGDLMSRWTNDRWTSTLHRVVQPDDSGGSWRRQSLAFFHNTNCDARIECLPTCIAPGGQPKYAPVLGGDYLHERFTRSADLRQSNP